MTAPDRPDETVLVPAASGAEEIVHRHLTAFPAWPAPRRAVRVPGCGSCRTPRSGAQRGGTAAGVR
ncbi:hypothetical protein NGM37_14900, partial [Streptomyces sp. TRM76130]|nr:hypothetical protein [Streptomyces sp. TRM76130]